MAINPKFHYDIVNIQFPNSPKKYAYRYTGSMVLELGHEAYSLGPGSMVIVNTSDGFRVVEVTSVLGRDNETDATMEKATDWIVDIVDTTAWKKRLDFERKERIQSRKLNAAVKEAATKGPAVEPEPEEDLEDLLGDFL